MNIENINKAIAVMERVKVRGGRIDMSDWMTHDQPDAPVCVMDESDLHTCGTAACFAGWLAVSPEWKEDGGSATHNGCPVMGDHPNFGGVPPVATWLDIGNVECGALCTSIAGEAIVHPRVYPGLDDVTDIDVDDVLAALYRLRDTGTVYLPDPEVVQ